MTTDLNLLSYNANRFGKVGSQTNLADGTPRFA